MKSKLFCEAERVKWVLDNPRPKNMPWQALRYYELLEERESKWLMHIMPIYNAWIESNGMKLTGITNDAGELQVTV
jgi:hypothetical protein